MDLCSLIDRNAAFAQDKTAIAFEGERLSYAALASRIERTATALKQELGVGRGDRVAILSLNRPDYLVLLYACARLGAMLVPLNWRLAVAEQRFILSDAGAKVLVLEQAFAGVLPELAPGTAVIGLDFVPSRGVTFEDLLARSEGSGRNPHTDLSCPLLVVYTSGTTGRPKGAVLRQEALFWNGVMSQHMHNMTSDDHVLTVLPFFHVGGLNIQTTPALQLGATVTIHARFTPDTALAAIERERPTLTVMVPAILQAVSEHPAWTTTDLSSLKAVSTGSTIVPPHLIDRFVARDVPVLQVYGSTETCPIAVYTRLGGDLSRAGSTGLAGLCCEAKVIDQAGNEVPAGTPGEIAVRGPNVFFEYWGKCGCHARCAARRLVSHRRYRPVRCRRVFLGPRPQEECDHFRRRERLSGRGRARPARTSRCQRMRRDRPAGPALGRGADRLRHRAVRLPARSREAESASSDAARPLQGSARHRLRQRPAAHGTGQGPAFPAEAA
ncbi:fatty-acyl-CoA synthase [Bradyrhizobium barranii subsp. barranii]